MARPPADDLPIEDNEGQRDEGQSHDIAEDALHAEDFVFGDSEHGGRSNPARLIPDDVPDLVDRMNEMVRSGHIDNDAFAGEPMHDDEEDRLGLTDSDGDDD